VAGAAAGAGGGVGFGITAFGSAGIGAERSTTFERVLMALSRIGSTWWRMPSLRSKSWIAGIIFERLCILLNTLTSGWESSSRVRIFLVNAFWMLFTAFFFAA
jgi:hypothetical protein